MIQSAITLRPAKPTLDEGMAYARYLDIAAEGFFRFMLGRKATEIIAKAYIQSGSDYSYENVLFAEQNHRLVGMASGFTAEQQRTFSDQPLRQAAGSQVIRMMVVRTLFASMIRILDMLDEGDFYLLSIATDEAVRGAGIGSALMDAMEERAVASGSVRLALDVSAYNAGARRLYERRGMAVASHWPRRLKIPRLKLYRMTKPLGASDLS